MNAECGIRIAEFHKRKIDTKLKKDQSMPHAPCPKPVA
jgi:hypothetical protein